MIPALFTRISTFPHRPSTSLNIALTWSMSETSACTANASAPLSVRVSTTSLAASGEEL